MSKVDLHIHTDASDGRFSPAEIVNKAVELGMEVIAVTDHDTVDGIAQALVTAETFPGLRVIPGVEISTDVPKGEAHVLGYFIDYMNQELQIILERMRNSRWERARKIVAKLADIGVFLDWGRVLEIAGSSSIGRPHIAQAMLEKNYISTLKEAFTKYIGRDGSAYVERDKMTPQEAIELILQAKGLPVLAHPFTILDPEEMIVKLKEAGLVGIEAYYNGYAKDEINKLVGLARKYSLIATGGSDFHGLDVNAETMIGGVNVPIESVEQLMALAGQQVQQTRL